MDELEKAKLELMQDEVHGRSVTMISTALAIVAGLFWQKAINDMLAEYIPVDGAWPYEIGMAIMITIVLAMIISVLNKPLKKNI